MSTYPAALWTPPTRADGVDQVTAADYNTPAAEIGAIEAELGAVPKGSYATVAARLARLESIGCEMRRLATSSAAGDTASGFRTLVGWDTDTRVDSGFSVSHASGTITVPSDGYYAVHAHARLSASYSGGFTIMTVNDGTNDILWGDQTTSTINDIHVSGVTGWVTASTALRARLYTATSTSLVGAAVATGPAYCFRVVRL